MENNKSAAYRDNSQANMPQTNFFFVKLMGKEKQQQKKSFSLIFIPLGTCTSSRIWCLLRKYHVYSKTAYFDRHHSECVQLGSLPDMPEITGKKLIRQFKSYEVYWLTNKSSINRIYESVFSKCFSHHIYTHIGYRLQCVYIIHLSGYQFPYCWLDFDFIVRHVRMAHKFHPGWMDVLQIIQGWQQVDMFECINGKVGLRYTILCVSIQNFA